MRLSVSMTAFNVEKIIGRTLEPLLALADEVIVVDSFSTDRTPEIARSLGATVIQRPWPGYIAQKDFAMAQTRGDWILAMDSDEVLEADLIAAISRVLEADGPADGYLINRRTFYMNRLLKHAWQPDWRLRLVRRSASPRWHGIEPHDAIAVDGRVERLPGYLVHYSYVDFSDHMRRTRDQAEQSARSYYRKGRRAGALDLLLRPPFALFRRMFLQGAFLDGTPGIMAAMSSAVYSYLKYAFLWEMSTEGGRKKTSRNRPDNKKD